MGCAPKRVLSDPNAIKDDLLRVMFSCCHPRLPEEAQVALTHVPDQTHSLPLFILQPLCAFRFGRVARSAEFLRMGGVLCARLDAVPRLPGPL